MLFSEVLKLRPELRPDPHMTNRIEKLVDLPRIARIKGHSIDEARIKSAVVQAESVYVASLAKSICMSEIEEENKHFIPFIKSFKVKRNELMRPRYHAL